MTKEKRVVERRKPKRFYAKDDTFAVLGPRPGNIGLVMDISMGGLAFSYVAGEDQPNRSYKLSILLAEHSFHLTKIPIETIWDKEGEQLPSSSLRMKRCGLQFGKLMRNQINQLEYYIENYANRGRLAS